ncbi:MAG: M4 family metallopeptidase [Calditrichaceae bacterium]|nr:M4 family metallopeptidase [Calditrichia bacterium]NUQ42399.1 M4 family metallopeptidase [Calditrichaceae bacterium]
MHFFSNDLRKTFLPALLLLLCAMSFSLPAQKKARETSEIFLNADIKLDESGQAPAAIRFETGRRPRVGEFFDEYRKAFPLSPENELREIQTLADPLGNVHHRYAQYYKGVEVLGAQYILHAQNGAVYLANGRLVPGLNVETALLLSEDSALEAALQTVGAESYMWQKESHEQFLKRESGDSTASFYPRGELKLSCGAAEMRGENFRLVYRFDIYAESPRGRYYVEVDARTGEALAQISRTHSIDVPGSGVSLYNGAVGITVDNFAGGYRLREAARSGLETYDMQYGEDYLAALDFIDPDTHFDAPEAAAGVSVHWAGEAVYDYFLTAHGRNSYDGAGAIIRSYARYGTENNSAFWDGTRFSFGDGDGWTHSPLVSLDIVAHEFTHAVVEHSAGLVYANESGALSESFSDIFAAATEFYKLGGAGNWLIGENVALQAPALRSLENPNLSGQPDTYLGNYWAPLSNNPNAQNDYGGVHRNGGVQNFWFYLLSQGGSGVNDFGRPYAVSGIGLADAAKIAYRALVFYLTPGAKYADAREASIQAAADLFGNLSAQVQAVKDAWAAVGVDEPPPPAGVLVWEGVLNGANYSGAYLSAYLADAGFSVTYTNVFPPSLTGYDAVFLSFGNYGSDGSTLTEFNAGMAAAVKTYLEAGGRVYLEGGDALGYDQSSNSALLNLFGLFSASDGDNNPINGLAGQDAALTQGMLFTSSTQPQVGYIDLYNPLDGRVAFVESGYGNVAVQHNGSFGQRTFCFSYALAKLNDNVSPATRAELMAALAGFLIPGAPEIVLSPASFSFTVPQGDSLAGVLGIYNTGTSILSWSIRSRQASLRRGDESAPGAAPSARNDAEEGATDIYDSPEWAEKFRSASRLSDLIFPLAPGSPPPATEETGDILETFPAPGTPFPVGLAYDPGLDAVWVSDETAGKLYLVQKTAPHAVLQTITLSVGFPAGPYDLAVAGDTLYITDFNGGGTVNDAIYAVNKSNGALLGLWQLDGANNPNPNDHIDQVIGIAINDLGEFFVSNNVDKTIRKIELLPGGMWHTLQTFDSPVGKRTAGLDWDPLQGGFWVANIVRERVYLADENFNKVDSFPRPANLASGITAVPELTVWMCDFGTNLIYVIESAPPPAPWMSLSPRRGAVAAGGSENVEIRLDASGLDLGAYQADLIVTSNDPDERSLTLPLTMTIIPVNQPPQIAPIIDPQVNEAGVLQLPVSAVNPDSNSSAIFLRAKNLPPFAAFADSGNGGGLFTFSPGYEDAGIYPGIRVIATDNGVPALSDTLDFTLTVHNTNRPPEISAIANAAMDEGDTLEIFVSASDPDGDSLSFSTANFPLFGSVIDSGNGSALVRFIPGFEDAGTYLNLRVIVTDHGTPAPLSDFISFMLVVNHVNRPPTLAALPDTGMAEGQTLHLPVFASDPDGDDLALEALNLPAFGSFSDHGNGTGTITFAPGYEAEGFYPGITVIVKDTLNLTSASSKLNSASARESRKRGGSPLESFSDTVSFSLTVANTNRAPQLAIIEDQLMGEGDTLSVAISAIDPDGNAMALAVNGLPAFGSFIDHGNGSGTILFSPGFNSAGNYPLEVIAADNGVPALADTAAFLLTVNGTNRAPVVSAIADQEMNEADTLEISVSALDPDGDTIVLSVLNLPAFGAFTDSGNGHGSLRFLPGYSDAGVYPNIQVKALDNGVPALFDLEIFTLAVLNLNRAPLLTPVADQTASEGDTLLVSLSASDPDGDSLVFAVSNLPAFGVLDDSGNGRATIRFAPGYDASGIYPDIQVIVADTSAPVLFDQDMFTLTVLEVNRAPVAVNDADTTDEGISVLIAVLANDFDPDGDEIAIQSLISAGTVGTPLFTPGDTAVLYQPAPNWGGLDQFAYVIGDGRGGLDTAAVSIWVQAVNAAPVISGLPDSLRFDANASDTLDIWAAVEDEETPDSLLIYQFAAFPDTLALDYDSASGLLVVSAKNPLHGASANLVITVSDPQGASASDTIAVEVLPVLGIEDGYAGQVPREYLLMQNYPNPFNPETRVRYGLPRPGRVKIEVFNLLGQRVAVLVDEYKPAGYHLAAFEGRSLASGIYFYLIRVSAADGKTGDFHAVKKMMLLK